MAALGSGRNWLLGIIVAGGVVGGGAVALHAVPSPAPATPSGPGGSGALSSTAAVDAQVRALLADERALRIALHQARQRLHATNSSRTVTQVVSALPATTATAAPPTHVVTGASGAGHGEEEHEGGGGDD